MATNNNHTSDLAPTINLEGSCYIDASNLYSSPNQQLISKDELYMILSRLSSNSQLVENVSEELSSIIQNKYQQRQTKTTTPLQVSPNSTTLNTSLNSSVHQLSLYDNETNSQFSAGTKSNGSAGAPNSEIVPSLQQNSSQVPPLNINGTNQHISTASNHSWESISLTNSPTGISPHANIWSPHSSNSGANTLESPPSFDGYPPYHPAVSGRKYTRPRSFSSPLLFGGVGRFGAPPFQSNESSEHTTLNTIQNDQYSNDSQMDYYSRTGFPNDRMYTKPNHHTPVVVNEKNPISTASTVSDSVSSSTDHTSSDHTNETTTQQNLTSSHHEESKLTEAQLTAVKGVSNLPKSDPIWNYKKWQLLEMYDKIKKDYPSSPDLGEESLKEEVIYHILQANWKWKCELCCRYNATEPQKSLCRFRKTPWRCYFAHGTEELRRRRRTS